MELIHRMDELEKNVTQNVIRIIRSHPAAPHPAAPHPAAPHPAAAHPAAPHPAAAHPAAPHPAAARPAAPHPAAAHPAAAAPRAVTELKCLILASESASDLASLPKPMTLKVKSVPES